MTDQKFPNGSRAIYHGAVVTVIRRVSPSRAGNESVLVKRNIRHTQGSHCTVLVKNLLTEAEYDERRRVIEEGES
jgi:hypothetical protein